MPILDNRTNSYHLSLGCSGLAEKTCSSRSVLGLYRHYCKQRQGTVVASISIPASRFPPRKFGWPKTMVCSLVSGHSSMNHGALPMDAGTTPRACVGEPQPCMPMGRSLRGSKLGPFFLRGPCLKWVWFQAANGDAEAFYFMSPFFYSTTSYHMNNGAWHNIIASAAPGTICRPAEQHSRLLAGMKPQPTTTTTSRHLDTHTQSG